MKKLIAALSLVMCTLLLCSCTRLGGPIVNNNDGEKADARLEQVIEAIENKDKESLRAMFSTQALSEADNLDERMDYLFDFVEGDIESWESNGGSVYDSVSNGHHKTTSRYSFVVKTDKEEYLVFLLEYTEDYYHPENVGLYMLQVIRTEDKDTQYDAGHDIISAGIYKPNE